MILGNVVCIGNASLQGHVVRTALHHEMEQLLAIVRPLRDPDVRRYFERLFWVAAATWSTLILGPRENHPRPDWPTPMCDQAWLDARVGGL